MVAREWRPVIRFELLQKLRALAWTRCAPGSGATGRLSRNAPVAGAFMALQISTG